MPKEDAKLDPFAGEKDPNKALLHRLLAVPALRRRYADYMREMAATWLDWAKLEPIARRYQALIAADVARDTRKLSSTGYFTKELTEETREEGPFGSRPRMSLKQFVEERREYLLGHPALAQR